MAPAAGALNVRAKRARQFRVRAASSSMRGCRRAECPRKAPAIAPAAGVLDVRAKRAPTSSDCELLPAQCGAAGVLSVRAKRPRQLRQRLFIICSLASCSQLNAGLRAC